LSVLLEKTSVAGLLLVDKPQGWTSHDVVAAVRRLLPKKTRVGHTGTLDPMATGLLVLLVGRATKSAARHQGLDKTYEGSIRLGLETDTGDLDGKTVKTAPVPGCTARDLQAVMDRFHGEVVLPVPQYSAVKRGGRPLYEYARRGLEVPVVSRASRISSWELRSWEPPEASFRLDCSSGTYARSLAVLLGNELGCGGTLSRLRRERVGPFSLQDAKTLEQLKDDGVEAHLRHEG